MIRTFVRHAAVAVLGIVGTGLVADASASAAAGSGGRSFSLGRLERACTTSGGEFVGAGSVSPSCIDAQLRGQQLRHAEQVCELLRGAFAVVELDAGEGTASWTCDFRAL